MTSNDPRDVVTAAASERERCTAALVAAFVDDPLLRWMLPDPAAYLAFFPKVLRFYGGRAFEHGAAYRSHDFAATALWLPPGVGPDEEALGAVVAEAVASERVGEVFAVLEAVGRAHPPAPHWFLPAIGVDPTRQGKGYGSSLLARALEPIDRAQAIAYLEASNPRNVPLYQRFGFEVVGEIQHGTSPLVIPMVRNAR